MIRSESDLQVAQTNIRNLEEVLRVACETYPPEDYQLMSEPFLRELNERRAEVEEYLATQSTQKVAA